MLREIQNFSFSTKILKKERFKEKFNEMSLFIYLEDNEITNLKTNK